MEITKQLDLIFKNNRPLRLLNVYKGVPIMYPASITGQTMNAFELNVHKFQVVCLHQDRHTFIQSQDLPSVIKASIFSLEVKRCTALLRDFQFASNTIGNRRLIRAQPGRPLDAVLLNEEKSVRTKVQVIDISISGIAVSASSLLFNPNIFRQKTKVLIQLDLPDQTGRRFTTLSLTASIANLTPDARLQRWRIGMLIYPDENCRALLTQYITQRQAEVLREIKETYDLLASAG